MLVGKLTLMVLSSYLHECKQGFCFGKAKMPKNRISFSVFNKLDRFYRIKHIKLVSFHRQTYVNFFREIADLRVKSDNKVFQLF